MIKVSIIMPSLNVAAYIEESVKSVMDQTLQDIEIICVDAGSTDGTLEIIKTLAKSDDRICLIESDKKSYGYQVNCGIAKARGEYVAIVETDDYVDTQMYEILYHCAKEYNVDIVKANFYTYWTQNTGGRVFRKRNNFTENSMYDCVVSPKEKDITAIEDWYIWTGIYRKQFLLDKQIKLSESPGAAFQDIGFIHRTNTMAESACYITDYLYYYCIDREDSSSNLGKALRFAFHEYKQLLKDEWDVQSYRLLYLRMAKSFVCSCSKITEENIANSEYCEQFAWFVDMLNIVKQNEYINEKNIVTGIWKKLDVLMEGLETAYQEMHTKEERISKTLGVPGEHEIIIFGCGDKGHEAYRILQKKKYDIILFMDNNSTIWESDIEGVPIVKPQNLIKDNDNLRYIIANEVYYGEIEKQLMELGVDKSKICIYF